MGNFRGWELLIVLAVLLLLFGAKRLPDTARGLGRSLRILKAETKGMRDDDERDPLADRPRAVDRSDPQGIADSRGFAPNGSTALDGRDGHRDGHRDGYRVREQFDVRERPLDVPPGETTRVRPLPERDPRDR